MVPEEPRTLDHLRLLVHDERLVSQWASDVVLPLIKHALATTPNSEVGGWTPAELKFGTLDFKHFKMPQQLVPGHHYGEFVLQLAKIRHSDDQGLVVEAF